MENQHKKIKGYRDLTQEEIDLMNLIKEKAAEVGLLVGTLEGFKITEGPEKDLPLDGRWMAIGKTDLQKGFMALTRAVAKPGFF